MIAARRGAHYGCERASALLRRRAARAADRHAAAAAMRDYTVTANICRGVLSARTLC